MASPTGSVTVGRTVIRSSGVGMPPLPVAPTQLLVTRTVQLQAPSAKTAQRTPVRAMPGAPLPVSALPGRIQPGVGSLVNAPQRVIGPENGMNRMQRRQIAQAKTVLPPGIPTPGHIRNSVPAMSPTRHVGNRGCLSSKPANPLGRAQVPPFQPPVFAKPLNTITSGRREVISNIRVSPPVFQKSPMQPKLAVAQLRPELAVPILTPRPPVQPPLVRRASLPGNYRVPQVYPGPRRQPSSSVQTNETVQPMLLAGLAIAGVGALYAGYRYYRHRRRENTIGRIRQEQAALAPFINQHIEGHGGVGVTSYARTINNTVGVGARTYDVYINLDDPVGSGGTSPALVESARVHERTHISADQSYTANVPGESQLIYHAGGAGALYHSYPLYDRAQRLLEAIASDNALTDSQRKHLKKRVKKNSIKPNEWDSTINELLVYTRYSGIRANSRTVKLLVQYAEENLAHRQGTITDLPRSVPHMGNAFHQNQEAWSNIF